MWEEWWHWLKRNRVEMKLGRTGNCKAEGPGDGLVAKGFDSILKEVRNH